jgi:hypothetical protein
MVPTSPENNNSPAKVPAPSQPSGVFGQLTAVLAGSVVPPLFLTPVLKFAGLAAEIALLILLPFLFVQRVAYVFGSWTRRGGYAHAPRSDVAFAVTANTLFATPLNFSYASGYVPSHSSFFGVSKNKTV